MIADAAMLKQLNADRASTSAPAIPSVEGVSEVAEDELRNSSKELGDSQLKIAELTTRVAELEKMLDSRPTPSGTPVAQPLARMLTPGSDRLNARIEQLEKDLQQANLKYINREKRMHQVLDTWHNKPTEEQTFQGLHQALSVVVNAPDRFRRVGSIVGMAQVAYSSLKEIKVGESEKPPVQAIGHPPKSKACIIQ